MDHLLLLLGAGMLGGAMNALAGGGSFVTFPALVAAGLPSIVANASSTVALFPAGLASAWAYRRGLTGVAGVPLKAFLLVSLAGGLAGSVLLLTTPEATFDAAVPWLLLLASLALAFGRQAGAALQRSVRLGPVPILALQFVLAVYGGYFGAAVGIMMMAAWGLLGTADLKQLAPARTLVVTATNAIAVLCFVASGVVRWPETVMLLLGAVAGGYLGALLALRLPAAVIRIGTLALTFALTAVFFLRAA